MLQEKLQDKFSRWMWRVLQFYVLLGDGKHREGEGYSEGLVAVSACCISPGRWSEPCLRKLLNSTLHCCDVQSGT